MTAIDRILREAALDPRCISFAGGLPAKESFPRRALAAAASRALSTPDEGALQYGWPEGERTLREWVASRLRARGADVVADDVIITAGAQQALVIAARRLLAAGAGVFVGPASYAGALDLFRSIGARLDAELRPDVACAYVMPGVANPIGDDPVPAWTPSLLAAHVPIIADEAYAELRFDGRPATSLVALARDRVWHVGTVSKTLCPGLRVGWLVPPRHELEAARDAKQLDDLQAGSLAQRVLAQLLASLDFDAHLAGARVLYAARATALVDALAASFPELEFTRPDGGFSVLAQIDAPRELDEEQFLAACARHGVVFDPGSRFLPSAPDGRLALRLAYSNHREKKLRTGVARLRRAWNECCAARSLMPRRGLAAREPTPEAAPLR